MIGKQAFVALATIAVVVNGLAVASGMTPGQPIPTDGLTSTPPMGFNNWTATYCYDRLNEAFVKGIADSMVAAGLKDAGYEYVNIDDCWALPTRDASGELVPDPARFPGGIKELADYVHVRGLKFGIYTSAGTMTCDPHGFPGSLGHEMKDASQFARWTVDYVKYDNCNNEGVDAERRYRTMRDALRATGRPIALAICEWGQNAPWLWPSGIGHLSRTSGDIADTWSSLLDNFHANVGLARYSRPGHWNDPDLLQVGNGGMTEDQYRSQFSLWSIMAAPLIVGTDLRNASPATLAILNNADVIAVDQDSLGSGGREVASSDGSHVIIKPLAGGDEAVALFNENATPMLMVAKITGAGFDSGRFAVKDLWSKDIHVSTGGQIGAVVRPFSTLLYRVGPVGRRPAGRWNLADIVALHQSNGWGPVETDRSNGDQAPADGHAITVHGVRFEHGLGVHAPSELEYNVGGNCSRVSASVGIDDEVQGDGSVVFQIYADGAMVADSGLVTRNTPTRTLSADISGTHTVQLVVTDGGDGVEFDHGDWADPILECDQP